MRVGSLRDLYVEQLQDLYNAEHQLLQTLPEMANAASSKDLRSAFEDCLVKTREHAQRIEIIFEQMGEKARRKKWEAMEGLVKESGEVIAEVMDAALKDAALIAAAQRAVRYEIAGYGCVRAHATILGNGVAVGFLARTLEEEEEADRTLKGIAERLNPEMQRETNKPESRTGGRRSMSVA